MKEFLTIGDTDRKKAQLLNWFCLINILYKVESIGRSGEIKDEWTLQYQHSTYTTINALVDVIVNPERGGTQTDLRNIAHIYYYSWKTCYFYQFSTNLSV